MPNNKMENCETNHNAFVESLDSLTPQDIFCGETEKTTADISAVLRKILLCVCLAVFAYSSVTVIHQLISKVRANNAYSNIRDIFYDDSGLTPDGALVNSAKSPALAYITGNVYQTDPSEFVDQQFVVDNKLNVLKGINPDVYGWIKIDGTRIDYPIVQGKDNDYYLHYTFEKEYLSSGALFVDFNNSKKITENRNTVIYGHNMSDGSMFNTLLNFKDKKFFENGVVEIITDQGIYIYEVFSVHIANQRDPYFVTEFANDQEFISYADSMQSQSMYTKKIKFNSNDRILTLSTCTNVRDYERFVVHAKLINPKK